MNVTQLRPTARLHAHLRDQIKEAFGLDMNSESDEQALADTLDGESDFKELIARAMREAKAREAMAKGIIVHIQDLQARKKRLLDGYQKARFAIAEAMLEAGETSIKTADMTINAKMGFPEPYVRDVNNLADEFKVTVTNYEPDFEAINAQISQGLVPEGVEIKNPQPGITVRIK